MATRTRESRLSAWALGAALTAFATVIVCGDRCERASDSEPVFGVDRNGIILELFDDFGMSARDYGLRVAVWDDGSYVLAARPGVPGVNMRCGKLDKEEFALFREFLNCNALATSADVTLGISDTSDSCLRFQSESGPHFFELTPGWPDCLGPFWEGPKSTSLKLAKCEWPIALYRLWSHPTAPYPRRKVGPAKIPTAVRPTAADLAPLLTGQKVGDSDREPSHKR